MAKENANDKLKKWIDFRDKKEESRKFEPEWMDDPKVLKEVIREQMIEYGEVIAEQRKKIERYEKALKEIAEETGTPYAEIARKALEV